jgi:hypothetical protein
MSSNSNLTSLGALRLLLARDAAQLGSVSIPVDVIDLVKYLGLGLIVEHSVESSHSGALRQSRTGWDVVIRRPKGRSQQHLTDRERFTVAHEIAHYLIEARVDVRPRSGGEYWRLEEVCNEFASRLLLPDSFVEETTGDIEASAERTLSAVNELAKRARVSHEVVARRLSTSVPFPILVAGLDLSGRSATVHGSVTWCVQTYEWKRIGARMKIKDDSPLRSAAQSALARSEGEGWPLEVDDAILAAVRRLAGQRALVAALLPSVTNATHPEQAEAVADPVGAGAKGSLQSRWATH